MNRVLVTGSSGRVGRPVVDALILAGRGVVPFDRALGDDIRAADQLLAAADGCSVIVHLAADMDESPGNEDEGFLTNVLGTWNVLRAAQARGVERVVFASSIQATGVVQGYRDPDYLPLDDAHPSYAFTPYAVSKVLGEQACAAITRATGISTVCLRPPNILAAEEYADWDARRSQYDETVDPVWNYGSWIDARDFADAIVAAVHCPDPGHVVLLVAADDISANRPGREVVAERYPDTPWRGGPEYDSDPYRSLVDIDPARKLLGWEPRFRWQDRTEKGQP